MADTIDRNAPATHGDMRDFIEEHKTGVMIGVIVTVATGFIFYKLHSQSAGMSPTPAGVANNAPAVGQYAASGYMTSDQAAAFTDMTNQLNGLTNQVGALLQPSQQNPPVGNGNGNNNGNNPVACPGGGVPVNGQCPQIPTNPVPNQPSGQSSQMPLIPYGQLPAGINYSNAAALAKNPYLNYGGTSYLLKPGADNRLWGINPQGQQVLLYENQSAYPTTGGTGGGPTNNSLHASNVGITSTGAYPYVS